ncbi:MAG: branched-chain amino acid ABC transporter substrate-binding protein [Gammaproteobacteria bacterium]
MKSYPFIGLSTLVLALGLAACDQKSPEDGSGAAVIKIGSAFPLTGPISHLGKDHENGARMAIDELNAKGVVIGATKIKLLLVSEDDQGDPKTATIVAQKLVDQQVKGVIGHYNSGASIPASRIYSEAGIPQISPSSTAIAYTAQGFKSAFRVMTNDLQQGKVLGGFAVAKMGAKKVAIIDDRTAYGQGLADEVERAAKDAGAEIVAHEYTTDRSTDFSAILTSIKAKNPDVLFYGGMDVQAGPMIKQMRSLGLTAKLLGGDGMQSAEFIKIAGGDAEGVIASTPGLPLATMPNGKVFEEKFNAKYGKVENYAPYAYDAVMVLVAAMQKAGSAEPEKYLPMLMKTDQDGVTGHISFDDKGDIKGGAVTLYRVHDGEWSPLETLGGTVPVDVEATVTQ